MQFHKDDKVLVIRNTIPEKGIVIRVKDFCIKREFNTVKLEDGTIGHYKNEELIKD